VDATSYFKQGYQFMPKFRQGFWDGRIKLFSQMKKTFPAGLTFAVKEALEEAGVRVQVDDRRDCPPLPPRHKEDTTLHGVSFDYPYDFQLDAMEKMILGQRGIAAISTNGGKTEIACLISSCLRLPTLFLVPGKELLYQTQKRFATRFGISTDEIGIIGDKQWKPDQWMTVATVASLYARLNKKRQEAWDLLMSTQLLFIDECHKASADTWYDVVTSCDAFFRFGLSGTPLKRTDGADLRLLAATGPVLYEMRNKELIERGISSEVEVQMLPIRKPEIPKGTPYHDAYKAGIVNNIYRNRAISVLADRFVKEGKSVVILVKEIPHGWELDKRLWTFRQKSFLTHQFINGEMDSSVRQQALRDFEQGDLKVLIATSILDEGVDLPNIDVLIMAGGGKSSIKTLQRVGRGIRMGGSGKLIVVDFIDFLNNYLLEHSLQRFRDYRDEDCFDIREISLKEVA
jgi:superfamily II DNA or RNA helicase